MTPGRTPWSFRVMASGDRGPNDSEIVEMGFARYESRNLIFPSRGSWACGPPPEMKVSARARPRCCGGTPPSQGGSTGSIPVGRSTAQHNASPSPVSVSERLDFQGRGSRVRSPSPAPGIDSLTRRTGDRRSFVEAYGSFPVCRNPKLPLAGAICYARQMPMSQTARHE
jgi:hypothetical protein